ncbi:MAG: sigma-54 factor interaction domain-containing protein, partial [Gemmatimonadetes bacterium]|nr:sigma-54 factor interaction domain-containing protein [Gemmatimonadota bacterium]
MWPNVRSPFQLMEVCINEHTGERLSMSQTSKPTAKVLSQSPLMAPLLEKAAKVAKTNKSVLLLGETGVGK